MTIKYTWDITERQNGCIQKCTSKCINYQKEVNGKWRDLLRQVNCTDLFAVFEESSLFGSVVNGSGMGLTGAARQHYTVIEAGWFSLLWVRTRLASRMRRLAKRKIGRHCQPLSSLVMEVGMSLATAKIFSKVRPLFSVYREKLGCSGTSLCSLLGNNNKASRQNLPIIYLCSVILIPVVSTSLTLQIQRSTVFLLPGRSQ